MLPVNVLEATWQMLPHCPETSCPPLPTQLAEGLTLAFLNIVGGVLGLSPHANALAPPCRERKERIP